MDIRGHPTRRRNGVAFALKNGSSHLGVFLIDRRDADVMQYSWAGRQMNRLELCSA